MSHAKQFKFYPEVWEGAFAALKEERDGQIYTMEISVSHKYRGDTGEIEKVETGVEEPCLGTVQKFQVRTGKALNWKTAINIKDEHLEVFDCYAWFLQW